MDGNFFEQTFAVRFYETGAFGELGVINLMNYFEEVALLQSESRGVGLDYYKHNHVIWMLYRWSISMFKAPVFGQEIKIRTLPVSVSGFIGYRKFWVYDTGGATMAIADSAWIFLNTQTKRPMRVSDDMKTAYGHSGKQESKMEMHPVMMLNKPDYSKALEVLKADIDMNRHAHNTRYVHWALETLPETFLIENRLVGLNVEYKKETTLGQVVSSDAEFLNDEGSTLCAHRISTNENGIAANLSSRWGKR